MIMCYIFVCFLLCAVVANTRTVTQRSHFCYKRLCVCSKKKAFCTNKGTQLNYIPPLPHSITSLNFSGNSLDVIDKQSFSNITSFKITALALRKNKIQFISAEAFLSFTRLKTLDLSWNPVNLPSLKGVLKSFSTLVINLIALDRMGYGDKLYDAITFLNSTTITELQLSQNNLNVYNQTIFKHLHRLRHIKLDDNHISEVYIDDSAKIKTFSINRNRLEKIPEFCSSGSNRVLTYLYLDDNWIRSISQSKIHCLKRLNILTLNRNPVRYIHTNTFALSTSLQTLKCQNLKGPLMYIDEYAFNNSKLFKIDLRNNGLNADQVNHRMFYGCDNLERLYLSYNNFYHLSESDMEQLLLPLKTLRKLDFGNCGLRAIPRVVTNNLLHLTWLSLYKNLIRSWSPGTFDRLRSLRTLYLGYNRIAYIQENSFPKKLREQLTAINLAGNQFDCSCQLLWFVNWFKINRTIFKENNKYICMSPKSVHNVNLLNLHLSERKCLLSERSIFVIVVVTSIFICLTVVASAVYRKRWLLRYCVYMRKHKQQMQRELEEDYVYDVFVIYCEEDLQWITEEMLPFLENTKHLKLCIQERDFLLGKPMIDNIVECVEQSRNFIMVASNRFVEAGWCQHQLMLVQAHLQEHNLGRLVVILLEEIDDRHTSPIIYAVLKTKEYIYWPDREEDNDRFWQQIYNELTLL